jgi:hypothetical protein
MRSASRPRPGITLARSSVDPHLGHRGRVVSGLGRRICNLTIAICLTRFPTPSFQSNARKRHIFRSRHRKYGHANRLMQCKKYGGEGGLRERNKIRNAGRFRALKLISPRRVTKGTGPTERQFDEPPQQGDARTPRPRDIGGDHCGGRHRYAVFYGFRPGKRCSFQRYQYDHGGSGRQGRSNCYRGCTLTCRLDRAATV